MFGQKPVGVGNSLQMDIAVEFVVLPQHFYRAVEELHGIVGRFIDGGGEEKALDVIAAVEAHNQLAHFLGRDDCARHVRAFAVGTIFAVENAVVCHQHFEQGNAPPVLRKGMADPSHGSVSDSVLCVFPPRAGRRAGYVVFRAVRQNFQPPLVYHRASPFPFALRQRRTNNLHRDTGVILRLNSLDFPAIAAAVA